jgi:hypothetical protein
MTSHPTVGWDNRALSLWAVTSDPIHSSDIRSNIIDSRVDDEEEVREEVESEGYDDEEEEEERCGRNVDCPIVTSER